MLKEFGIKPNKVVVKNYNGKKYVIFKGFVGDRKIFTGTRYGVDNIKVVRMAVGPQGIVKSASGGFVLTAVLSVGMEVFDYFIRDSMTLSTLLGTITGDLIKIGISSIVAAVSGLAIGASVVLGTVGAAPLIIAIAVGVLVGIALNKLDAKYGATAALIAAYENLGKTLREIEYQVERDIKDAEYRAARWYNYFDTNPTEILRLFGVPSYSFRRY